ncbi:group II intron maturase-specific domain-containing protein [Pseudomonas aeruginosa]|uniref:group II intron maturase-specific domain-containing protein n=1 Tax=Pseudomonas aeruginosa TaxID=287 RepID=UPI00383B3EEC
MRDRVQSWRTHRWPQLTIGELADSFNPTIRGWINYYGRFYKSQLHPVFGQIDYAIVRWTKRKCKRLGGKLQAGDRVAKARSCVVAKALCSLVNHPCRFGWTIGAG